MVEILTQVIQNLRANRLRSILTMFGILWGVVSVVVLSATGEGFQRGNQQVLETLGRMRNRFFDEQVATRFGCRARGAHMLARRVRNYGGVRPFFCQIEAVETAIWLTEVAPHSKSGKRLLDLLASANRDANPEITRLALKLATGAGKTTVMAMLIAWQTINAVRRPGSKNFTRGFLIVTPGLTIKDRLRVLNPSALGTS